MKRVLQIVPRVPPAVCGLGDYAWLLARELSTEHRIHSSFLAAGTSWTAPSGEADFPIFRLEHRTAAELLQFVRSREGEFDAVILHMSPYGYQKRGVPFWLADGWRQLSRLKKGPRLITMFHELHASGSLCTSAFWLQPLQKRLLRTVARSSDVLRTNREVYANWLRENTGMLTTDVLVMPVFSNMQEAAEGGAEPLDRWQGITVFASTFDDEQSAALAEVCCRLRIQRVGWIGRREPPSLGAGLCVRHIFHLPTPEARGWFRSHGHAWTSYNPEFLAKSGIFAAFAAHRTAVVLPGARGLLADGLMEGVHYMTPSSASPNDSVRLSQVLQAWYRTHNVAETAASYAAQITGKSQGSLA